MSQVKDFPVRQDPKADDFFYLITDGNSDYQIKASQVLGRILKKIAVQNYTLELSDAFKTLRNQFPSSATITIPEELNVAFVEGTEIKIRNASNYQMILQGENISVILNTKSNLNVLPHGEVSLVYVGGNEWDLTGDLI